MRNFAYVVHFIGNVSINIEAMSRIDAVTLACAQRIRDGLHCDIERVECENGRDMEPNNPKRHCIRLALIADAPLLDA